MEPRRPSALKPIAITLAVIALVGCTILTLVAISFAFSMRNFGSNK